MLIYKEEKVKTSVEILVQYPAYYRTAVFSPYYIAVFSDVFALRVGIDQSGISLWQSTPAYVFSYPTCEDYERTTEQEFLGALQQSHQYAKLMLEIMKATQAQ